ncbi:MAG TPA: hypothetical protein VGB91_04610 [Rhizomicrobium sp.]
MNVDAFPWKAISWGFEGQSSASSQFHPAGAPFLMAASRDAAHQPIARRRKVRSFILSGAPFFWRAGKVAATPALPCPPTQFYFHPVGRTILDGVRAKQPPRQPCLAHPRKAAPTFAVHPA